MHAAAFQIIQTAPEGHQHPKQGLGTAVAGSKAAFVTGVGAAACTYVIQCSS